MSFFASSMQQPQRTKDMTEQPTEVSSFRKLIAWLAGYWMLLLAMFIFVLVMWTAYQAIEGKKSEATTDEIVDFMAENSCHEIAGRELVTHGHAVTKRHLASARQRCAARVKAQEVIRKFDAMQAQTEQQPGIER